MKTSAFPRIARQLNYKRSFPTVITSRVDIPGFPYEAFNNTGTQVQPWNLLRMFESVRAYTFWQNVSEYSPERSMVDMHEILQSHFVFIIGAKVEVSKELHDTEIQKYPLYVNTTLTQVGKSSKTLSYELRHNGTDVLLSKCDITDVLVSRVTRKPVTYPDWWLEKYGQFSLDTKPTILDVKIPTNGLFTSTARVHFSDTDTYRHTNWSSYIKYCYDCLNQQVETNKYKNISASLINSGIKSFDMAYSSESNFGDDLSVKSWEDPSFPRGVYFSISKHENPCFLSKIQFYPPKTQSKL